MDRFVLFMLGWALGGLCGVAIHAFLTGTLFVD